MGAWNKSHLSTNYLTFSFSFSAHNWTVGETARWVSESVELPEYGAIFIEREVDGESLPRYALPPPTPILNLFISSERVMKFDNET